VKNQRGDPLSPQAVEVIDKIKAGAKITYDDRKILYNDNSVKLNVTEDARIIELAGIPIHIEHKTTEKPVGKILDSWVKSSNQQSQLMVLGEVWDQSAKSRVDNGELRGLSIGYGFTCIPVQASSGAGALAVDTKRVKEISLCKEPFYHGCEIDITASKKDNAKSRACM
jgi:hypothetical protein